MALKFGYEAAVGVAAGPIGAHHHLGHHNQQHLAVFVILEADLTPMAPRCHAVRRATEFDPQGPSLAMLKA